MNPGIHEPHLRFSSQDSNVGCLSTIRRSSIQNCLFFEPPCIWGCFSYATNFPVVGAGSPSTPSQFVAIGYILGCPPLPVIVESEGLVRDPLLKMVHNPGGDSYWGGGTTQTISIQKLVGGSYQVPIMSFLAEWPRELFGQKLLAWPCRSLFLEGLST